MVRAEVLCACEQDDGRERLEEEKARQRPATRLVEREPCPTRGEHEPKRSEVSNQPDGRGVQRIGGQSTDRRSPSAACGAKASP